MADKTNKSTGLGNAAASSTQDSYRLAKLIRQGSRELSRQYNTKKTRRER